MTKLDLPVYESKSFSYVRINDISDFHLRQEFNQFMRGKTQPLIYKDKQTIQDAVFINDYDDFLVYLDKKFSEN